MTSKDVTSSTRGVPESTGVPTHVAMIMDGNGRWAQGRGKPRFAGHRQGVESVRDMVKACRERGVQWLTLFAFSSENWRRPETEVKLLMQLLATAFENEIHRLHRNNVRLRVIGDLEAFAPGMRRRIERGEELTADNDGLTLQIAINYGGRWDITTAVKQIAAQVAAGEIAPDDIQEQHIENALSTGGAPEPDLFIRTGGEKRISNFLMWQLAYSELYFTDTLWPDFNAAELDEAIAFFAGRQRRFGRTGEQVLMEQKASDA